jgi:hypothetical protein
MALTDEEARQFADNLIADYLAGVEPDPISVYSAITDDDQIPIGKHLLPPLAAALEAFNNGERGADTIKLGAMVPGQRQATRSRRGRSGRTAA